MGLFRERERRMLKCEGDHAPLSGGIGVLLAGKERWDNGNIVELTRGGVGGGLKEREKLRRKTTFFPSRTFEVEYNP